MRDIKLIFNLTPSKITGLNNVLINVMDTTNNREFVKEYEKYLKANKIDINFVTKDNDELKRTDDRFIKLINEDINSHIKRAEVLINIDKIASIEHIILEDKEQTLINYTQGQSNAFTISKEELDNGKYNVPKGIFVLVDTMLSEQKIGVIEVLKSNEEN